MTWMNYSTHKNSCTSHDCRIGEYFFCEEIKVDLAESEDKLKKTAPDNQESAFKHYIFSLHTIRQFGMCY